MLHHIADTSSELAAEREGVRERVEGGRAALFRIAGTSATVVLSVGLAIDTNRPALWVEDVVGVVSNRPHDNLRVMQDVLAECEQLARAAGCEEVRIEASTRTNWKTALLPRFGFTEHRVGSALVMRKVLLNG